MLEQLVTTIITYLNASGYYKTADEIKNAINVAQLDLYKRLRGNLVQYAPGRPQAAISPEQTNTTADAISELYYTMSIPGQRFVDLVTAQTTYKRTIDLVMSIEVAYLSNPNTLYPVNIVPDNQFLMLKNNPVVPPIKERPIGRMTKMLTYEVLPYQEQNGQPSISTFSARVLTLPNPVDFRFEDVNGPVPKVVPIVPIDWSYDKLDNLVYGTVANLGFNLSNGVLVQSGNAMNNSVL
jgi:hypothetical protein